MGGCEFLEGKLDLAISLHCPEKISINIGSGLLCASEIGWQAVTNSSRSSYNPSRQQRLWPGMTGIVVGVLHKKMRMAGQDVNILSGFGTKLQQIIVDFAATSFHLC